VKFYCEECFEEMGNCLPTCSDGREMAKRLHGWLMATRKHYGIETTIQATPPADTTKPQEKP
jgi:hypothetical protein